MAERSVLGFLPLSPVTCSGCVRRGSAHSALAAPQRGGADQARLHLTRAKLCAPAVASEHGDLLTVAQLSPGTQVGKPKIQIGKPKTSISQPTSPTETEKERQKKRPKPKYKTESDEIPLYKVILLGDEGYDEVHVTTQMVKVVSKLTSDEAAKIYSEAQATGSSIICVVNKEHAEFFAQQLRRQEIFVVVEADK